MPAATCCRSTRRARPGLRRHRRRSRSSSTPSSRPDGQVIIYAALSGSNGGIWRSVDTGKTWQLMRAGQATDVVLDPASGHRSTRPSGNLQIVYAAFRGEGVFISPNQGQVWNLMTGGIGNPLIVDIRDQHERQPGRRPDPQRRPGADRPGQAGPDRQRRPGPDLRGLALRGRRHPRRRASTALYPDQGLRPELDPGPHPHPAAWPAPGSRVPQAIPTNDVSLPDYTIVGGRRQPGQLRHRPGRRPDQPQHRLPRRPASTAQTGLIRDRRHQDLGRPRPGRLLRRRQRTAASILQHRPGPVTVGRQPRQLRSQLLPQLHPQPVRLRSCPTPTLRRLNVGQFTNNGAGVEVDPVRHRRDRPPPRRHDDRPDHRPAAARSSATTRASGRVAGQQRDVQSRIGTASSSGVDRNGNLQITQFYYGAAQPSNAAAQIAGALFYGSAQDNGGPRLDRNVLTTGNIGWSGPGGDATGVATDQQGTGTVYQYFWPCCGGGTTPTSSRSTASAGRSACSRRASGGYPTPDPQWPFTGGANFAVNPLNGNQIIISSAVGRIFSTENQGVTWFDIGDPAVFGSPGSFSWPWPTVRPTPTPPAASATSATSSTSARRPARSSSPRPAAAAAAATTGSTSPPASTAAPSRRSSPTRSAAATRPTPSPAAGVFYIADSVPSATNPTTPTVGQHHRQHPQPAVHDLRPDLRPDDRPQRDQAEPGPVRSRRSWPTGGTRSPNNPTEPSWPGFTRCSTSSGNSGVYRSLDNGQTWTLFPDHDLDGAPAAGRLSAPRHRHRPRPVAGQHRSRHGRCPTWPARTTRTARRPPIRTSAGLDLRPWLVRHQAGSAGLPQHRPGRPQQRGRRRHRWHPAGQRPRRRRSSA